MVKIKFETKYTGNSIYLISEEAVQNEFLRVVENISKGREPFWDELSLKIMAEVDGARREGDYTIVTKKGRGCMHSLSHECQMALILVYGQKRYRVPRKARLAIMSTKTLALLNNLGIDIDILLPVSEGGEWILPEQVKAIELLAATEQFEVEGEMIGEGISGWKESLRSIVNEVEYYHRGMDPVQEAKAYRLYFGFREKERIISEMKQEMSMADFLRLFGENTSEYDRFRIVNTCRTLCLGNGEGERMLILLDGNGVHQYNIPIESVGRILTTQILDRCCHKAGKVFALLTRCEPEEFRTTSYPEQTELGVMVDWDKKEIMICHKHLAVREYHRLYVDVFGEWVEDDD